MVVSTTRLDQELPPDVSPGGAEGLADADLAGALVHRHQHDVHDDDATDHDADADHGGNGGEEQAR